MVSNNDRQPRREGEKKKERNNKGRKEESLCELLKYNLLHMIQVPSTSLWTDSLGLRIKTVLMREQTLKRGWTRKPQLRKTYLGFLDGSEVKNWTACAGDPGSLPG